MIRTCLEFLLSRSLDDAQIDGARIDEAQIDNAQNDAAHFDGARPLAPWLQRRVERDPQLKQFDTEARQLDSLLRSAAAKHRGVQRQVVTTDSSVTDSNITDSNITDWGITDWGITDSGITDSGAADGSATGSSAILLTLLLRRQESRATARVRNSGLSAVWLTSLAVAAVLLLVASPSWPPNWFRRAAPGVHAGEFSQQLTVVPGEVLRLLTRAAETSRTRLPQLSPLANLTLPTLPAWEDIALHVESPMLQEPLLREIDTWHESWKNFKSRLPDSSFEL